MMKSIFFLILGFGHYFNTYCQKADQFNSWSFYSLNLQLNNSVQLNSTYSWSRNDFMKNWQQSKLSNKLALKGRHFGFIGGYEWVVLFPYGEFPIPEKRVEHRIIEAFEVFNNIGQTKMKTILTIEQRIFVDKFKNRMRLKFSFKRPLNNYFSISCSNTVFLNFGKVANNRFFNQNRGYFGMEFRISQNFIFTTGYLNQFLVLNEKQIENNHTLIIGLKHRVAIDNTKK